jgi:eukaryotic-like serine/threonine-protein kinase
MECPQCGLTNPAGTSVCITCSTPLPLDGMTLAVTTGAHPPANPPNPPNRPAPTPPPANIDFDRTLTTGAASGSFRSPAAPMSEAAFAAALEPGRILGNRYEILQILGQGGMGAVYKARDTELDRLVALKVIRPELAQYSEVLQRFKQELILARQVTHRNVIRIYDLGEAEGIKFITMDYIEGRDLKSMIREKGKFEAKEAVDVVVQVARALEAAHGEGVIHRDLKPQNIMVEQQGRVSVMDFGIARSMEEVGGGMTQTGALMGTIEYMSPEQAKGEKLDARTDLFSLGIIFYETLTGNSPYKADTAMASLYKRLKEVPKPPSELVPGTPAVVNNIVMRCLEIEKEKRYSSAAEIIQDLEVWQGARAGTVIAQAPPLISLQQLTLYWKWLATALAVLFLGLGVFIFRGKLGIGSPTAQGPVAPQASLAILPFRNGSGDPALDWLGPSLADMLSTDVGQSQYMRTISADRLHQVLGDLRVEPNTSIDPTMVTRIADFSSADTVVWGEYAKFGDQIRIDATLQDLKHNRSTPLKIEAASEKDIPGSVDQLADLIRKNLSVSSDVLKEMKASSFQPTSTSVPALKDYNNGLQLLRDGKNLDATKAFQSATQEDPQFALAYSRLAEADSALGYDSDAEQASSKAVDLSSQLNVAERYLIEASHARITKDNKKAIEAYQNLEKTSPNNPDVEYALASVYVDTGDYTKAQAQLAKILQDDPKNLKALWQTGVVMITTGNPQGALDPLNKGLSLAVEANNQEQKSLILLALGVSYRQTNQPDEAMRNYQESMEISQKLGLKRIYSNALTEVAQVQTMLGKSDAALASYTQALQILNDIGMKKEYGNALIDRGVLYDSRGDTDKALQDYKDALEIQREANDQNYEALSLNNIGGDYLTKGDTDNALIYLQQSLELRQKSGNQQPQYMAETLQTLGEVYTATGDYDKALNSFMSSLDVSRKANDTWSVASESDELGKVFRYQGRMGAAVNAFQQAVAGYRTVSNRSVDMAQSLDDLAGSLALAGRGNESAKLLTEAQGLQHDLKNQGLESDVLNAQGDVAFYRGDNAGAQTSYQGALRAAQQAKARDKILTSKLNLAKVAISEGRAQSVAGDLKSAVQEADSLRLKYQSLQASIGLAESMISAKDYSHARQALESDLDQSQKLGSLLETAKIQYLLGNVLRLSGESTESASHYRQAVSTLDQLKAEQGADKLLDRSDLHEMYAQASRWAKS